MFTNKKVTPIFSAALSLALLASGTHSLGNEAYAADLNESQKSQLETSYFSNNVSNKASRMLLEEYPNLASGSESQLKDLVNKSDDVIKKTKPVVEKLHPERANESEKIKNLNDSIFNNKVKQESVFLLFELTPNKIEKSKDTFIKTINDSIKVQSKSEYTLNKLRGYKTISVVHVNDTHGRVEENEKNEELGFAKLKTYYDDKNVENNAILLNAGDVVHGTTFATIFKGESVVNVMNQMGFTAMTAGNHDFNYGYKRLVELNNKANFPIFAANVINENGKNILDSDSIVDVDGTKVGIFGLTTEETKTKSSPVNTEGLTFVNSIETARSEVANLKEQGAQVIICLSHLGEDKESTETSTLIAENVEGIDLIVDGHSHTELQNGRYVDNTLIAQAKAHGNFIGDVTLLLDKNNKIVSKNASLKPYNKMKYLYANKDTASQIEKVANENKKVLDQNVGQTSVELVGTRDMVRTRETNLGDFITDAMIKATGADIAITNGGGIRESIEKGTITKGDVLTVFPFTNFAVTLEVPGSVIKEALEHGLSEAPNSAGKFPQIGGMNVKYDSTKEAGQRVTEITINGQNLDMNKNYTVVTNDFMAIGGDGYEMFKSQKKLAEYELISEIFENAIKKSSTITPEADGRMQDISQVNEINKAA
ncbi:bifunctional metallophosphatase/5'-nucleotidase [Anaerococcus octavius]|uniref:bifunctional metallophosphatase/5'-nucleotidase n=1 Tax=Anaerococcus octavius TaxID=54007 RepID=UPI0027BB164A|nr:bifunctional UDP-sugar hydrolase/5'-nucleotidase [Anaerococcus octavius]MDU5230279.1 bifunctional UDP-sugar hydrolase/5'-nucleotidase [Anaerococcus sp.]